MITNTDGRSLSPDGELPPFPEGWYFVADRESILRKKLIEKTWMGQEIVAWCDDEGSHQRLGRGLSAPGVAPWADGGRQGARRLSGLSVSRLRVRRDGPVCGHSTRSAAQRREAERGEKAVQVSPGLCRADGPIGKFRQYCRQFYLELEAERRPKRRAI